MRTLFFAAAVTLAMPLSAAPLEDFSQGPAGQWSFFTDGVMGGVSQGTARLTKDALRLEGEVSTANNGGFIQVRRAVNFPDTASGIRLRVRGNGQRYFVHLRTQGTRLPWQYYQAGFDAPTDWTDVTLPLDAFQPSARWMAKTPDAKDVRSLAVVAYGRDHDALVEVTLIRID